MRALTMLFLLLCSLSAAALAQAPLVADLSKHLVAITTGFTGTEALLFGATDGPGDVVVVVRGPEREEIVRRKDRTGPIWMNRDSMAFAGVPTFYHIAATRPLADIAAEGDFARHQIGLEHLRLTPVEADRSVELAKDFRAALIRIKQSQGLYGGEIGEVSILGNQLFRTEVRFPANVPVGAYIVEVFLFRQGQVVSAQTTPLVVGKTGVGADIYDFAHEQAALYGMIAVLLAALVGWAAAAAFRKT